MRLTRIRMTLLVLSPLCAHATALNVDLGTASSFAVLGASAVTNTGSTVVTGNLGLSPDPSMTGITGFYTPGIVNGTIDDGNAVAAQAQSDALAAYDFAASTVDEPSAQVLSGDLGGLTLTPGVYSFSSSAQLTGTLTLDDEGNANAVFVFQIGSTLTTASNSSVVFSDSSGQSGNVFWQVGSSATLGTGTDFAGTILADQSITLTTDASIGCGRAIALYGAVTMDTNNVSVPGTGECDATPSGVPEPSPAGLLLLIGIPGWLWLRTSRGRAAHRRATHQGV